MTIVTLGNKNEFEENLKLAIFERHSGITYNNIVCHFQFGKGRRMFFFHFQYLTLLVVLL